MGLARISRKSIPLHRLFVRPSTAPGSTRPAGVRMLAMEALWLGLASGWLELGATLGHRGLVGTVTKVSVWLNWYHVPLGLLAHLAIFSAWLGAGSVAMFACRRLRLRSPERLIVASGWFLAAVSPLLSLEELHWAGAVMLAAGLAVRLGPWWRRSRGSVLRRTLVPFAGATALLAGLGFAWVATAERRAMATLPAAPTAAPNVVLAVLDTVRADHLSLYGYGRPTTPRLDALAERAVCFEFARSPATWTLPAHASMFTGRWPHELSADIDRPLDSDSPTLAEFLGQHGYRTGGFVGNTFYCNSWFGVDRGFACYEDTVESRTISAQQALRCTALGRRLMPLAVQVGIWPTTGQFSPRKTAREVNRDALAWLDRSGGRPFFLFLNYIDAHGPYTVPADFPKRFSSLSNLQIIATNNRARRRGGDNRLSAQDRRAAVDELARVGVDAYDECIRYVDDQIGRLLGELDRRGLDRNTWVIITADHGEHFGEHGKFWHGNSLYRPLVDVPLVIVPPKGGAGRRVAAPVSPRDLPATVADLVGLASASPFPGGSLRRHWDDAAVTSTPAEAPLSELKIPAEKLRDKGATAGRYRSAVVDRDAIYHGGALGPEELYDVSDRAEATNLAPSPESTSTLDHFRRLVDRPRPGENRRR